MGSRDKVLIVDDSELDRIALKKMLKDAYEIVEAVDGAGALRILESQKEFDAISAIILDLVMPQMDGFDFLREYRKVDSYRRIPVIVASVERDVKTEKACLALGARDFIGKPYDPQIVRFRVENAVRSSEQQLSRELRYRADYDMLTGIYNKTHFFEATRVLLKRHPEETYAFLRLDIEKFQLVNSFFGSSSGDGLLQYIAKEIRKFAGDTEQIAYGRIEADIFGICMPYRGEETMLEFVRYMRMRLGQYQLAFDVVPAIGIYVIRERDLSVDAMYDRANLAAKQCKGNYIENYAFYVDEMREDIVREQQIVNHMRHALDEEEFVLYLQPKYSLQDNRICGAEVLVRWAKPEGGMISPGEFIPVFERNGFITKLDYYVWEKTCKLLAEWIAEGKKPSPVSVNISRVSLYNPRLVEAICGLTDRYHIPRELLELELTESAYTTNPKAIKETMERLQKEGFSILMDDFGSGYSSLNVLKDIAVDVLKIDMKFLSDTDQEGRSQNILASVVRMAKWLNLPVIAEGVERREQVDFLHSVGCEYVQGFYFARPMPVSDYEKLVSEKKDELQEKYQKDEIGRDMLWNATSQMGSVFSGMMEPAVIYEYEKEQNRIDTLRVNNAYYDMFGYGDINSAGGLVMEKQLSDESRKILLGTFEDIAKSKETAACEFLRTSKNGRSIWVHLKLKYITSVGEKHIIVGTLTDITEQRMMDQELQKYRQVLLAAEQTERTMLVVDDQEVNRGLLKCIFEERYRILEAENGADAFEVLNRESGKVDIILLDLAMPVMDGMEFLKRKQQDAVLAGIPVIIITADDTTGHQIQMLQLGAEDYIVKPFVPEIAMRRVENVLGAGRLLKRVAVAGERDKGETDNGGTV